MKRFSPNSFFYFLFFLKKIFWLKSKLTNIEKCHCVRFLLRSPSPLNEERCSQSHTQKNRIVLGRGQNLKLLYDDFLLDLSLEGPAFLFP